MRRYLRFVPLISLFGFLFSWLVASLTYRFHLVESPLLEGALMLVTGTFCVLGTLLYCWRGVRWLRSTWATHL